MFPSQLFALFPPFPRATRVFVAISFADQFAKRWSEVIAPAIASVEVGGQALAPHRVDARAVSDSILTEILDGVSSDRLVFADITTMGVLNDAPVRNGNVLYEVGLAHAVRLPEEVLLFRSDDARLLFDVASIRVARYDPDGDAATARAVINAALVNALHEVDLRRQKAVEMAALRLGYEGWILLAESSQGLRQPVVRTMRDVMNHMGKRHAIPRLLDMGLIESVFPKWSSNLGRETLDGPAEEMFAYVITPFGRAVLERSAELIGLTAANIEQLASGDDSVENHEPSLPEA